MVPQPVNPSRGSSPGSSRSPAIDQIGSSSSPASVETSPSITTLMNASHYKMLLTGNQAALEEAISGLELSNLEAESDRSSVLHVAAMAGQVGLIVFIVTRFNEGENHHGGQHLLLRPNIRGDLPIHVAARAGKILAVEKLIECAVSSSFYQRNSTANANLVGDLCHQMLKAQNNNGNTALHIALENQQKVMAKTLFDNCHHTFYCLNDKGLSPLYLAIIAGFKHLAEEMLEKKFENPTDVEEQLKRGKVVYAAIMAKDLGTLSVMLKEYREVTKSYDGKGRRPLSYAAYTGFLEGVKYLLSDELRLKNIAFGPDEDGAFPIHSACSGGNVQVVKKLLNHSHNMMCLLNGKQQSILHVAADSGRAEVVNYILGRPDSECLINMKDEDGNTPLHLASKGKHAKVVYALTWDVRVNLYLQNNEQETALDVAEYNGQVPSFEERLTWLALRYAGLPKAPMIHHVILPEVFNPDQTTVPIEIANDSVVSTDICTLMTTRKGYMSHITPTNKYKERLNTLLMVSTLVATVTYASGFTVPGGYKQDNPDIGMAILAHRCAFQVFVISDTIALFSSILAAVTLIWAHLDDSRLILLALDFAMPLLGIALVTMCVAFMAGLYVTLHTQVWLGIVVFVMGGGFLGAVLLFFIPLYLPISRIKPKMLRYVFHVPFKLMLLACERGKSEALY
uniref:PGG domain-containing protein n=1 Tax=Opuntia streptacantha TaxID=393608 RepID=A0A7C9ENL1_OPUST